MKYWAILLILFASSALAKQKNEPLKVAVVDTGLDLTDIRLNGQLCTKGHKDFTGLGIADKNGHGTHVTGIIEKYAGVGNYCILIYKYYGESANGTPIANDDVLGFEEAIKNGAKIINFSGGGSTFNEREYQVISNHPEVTFVVAAGNEGKNIDTPEGRYYPASLLFHNIDVVGNLNKDETQSESSNWSNRSIFWEIGTLVFSTLPNHKYGYLSGTSMSAATHTGKLIRKFLNAK
jgi:subtilisin family serine protease